MLPFKSFHGRQVVCTGFAYFPEDFTGISIPLAMETEKVAPSSEREFPVEKDDGVFAEATETISHGPDGEKQERHGRNVIIDEDGEEYFTAPAETAEDLVTEVIHVTDDPSLNPWTFRTWFLGRYFHLQGSCVR